MALVTSPVVLHAAVGDDGHVVALGDARAVADGGDLRHAHAGDHASGADAPRPDADLDPVDARVDERLGGRLRGRHVAGDDAQAGELLLRGANGLEHAARVAVRRIDVHHYDVDARRDERRRPLVPVRPRADGRSWTRTQPGAAARPCWPGGTCRPPGGCVLDRDEPGQVLPFGVHDEELLDAVACGGDASPRRRSRLGGTVTSLLGHQRTDGLVEVLLEAGCRAP